MASQKAVYAVTMGFLKKVSQKGSENASIPKT